MPSARQARERSGEASSVTQSPCTSVSKTRPQPFKGPEPILSVIIKTFNEEDKIAACLASVQEATRRYPTQIIVADSRSEDETVVIARQFGTNVVTLAPSEPRGCGVGAQLGFQYSSGHYVLLMDGDMRLDPAFLPEALRAL